MVIYSVVLSFIFQYGVGEKMSSFETWTSEGCESGACLGQQGVFRVNLGVVAFYSFLFYLLAHALPSVC